MASTPYNNIVRTVRQMSMFEDAKNVISSASTYNQGDLLYFDTVNYILKPVAATGNAATICGVARQSVTSGKVVSPYPTPANSEAIASVAGPVYGVIATLNLKSGDAFTPGCKVYLSAVDAQGVTVTDPGDGLHIGVYQGKSLTAGSGATGEVLVGCRMGAETGGINF